MVKRRKENRVVAGIKYLLALLIVIGFVGGAFMLVTTPLELMQLQAARGWPSRDGIITVSSTTRSYSTKSGESWRPNIGGTYSDTGEQFWIARVRYGDFVLGSGKDYSEDLSRKYPVGRKVQVYYDPNAPREAILEPDAPATTMYTMLGVGTVLVAIPFLLYIYGRLTGYQPPDD